MSMHQNIWKKSASLLGVFTAIWLAIRYLLPLFLPFLFGTALAISAEPIVNILQTKLHLPRGAAAAIGVSLSLIILILLVMSLGALMLRELTVLAGSIPHARELVSQGLQSLQQWITGLARQAPSGIAAALTKVTAQLFSSGAALLAKATDWLLGLAAALLSRIPGSALGLGTGLLASYMISAKLPRIRVWLDSRIPEPIQNRFRSTMGAARAAAGHWLRAQIRLATVTFLILTGGLLLLRIHYAPLWAFLIALVDAVPMLGTGIVMVPWALISLLQGQHARSIGLLGIYIVAVVSRSVLEPRLVGRQMGIDPLLTLVSLYAGYRIWGVWGLLLAPMLTAIAIRLAELKTGQQK